jgi:hypothetical protein
LWWMTSLLKSPNLPISQPNNMYCIRKRQKADWSFF